MAGFVTSSNVLFASEPDGETPNDLYRLGGRIAAGPTRPFVSHQDS